MIKNIYIEMKSQHRDWRARGERAVRNLIFGTIVISTGINYARVTHIRTNANTVHACVCREAHTTCASYQYVEVGALGGSSRLRHNARQKKERVGWRDGAEGTSVRVCGPLLGFKKG